MPVMPAPVSSYTNIDARPSTAFGMVESWNGRLAVSNRRVLRILVIFIGCRCRFGRLCVLRVAVCGIVAALRNIAMAAA